MKRLITLIGTVFISTVCYAAPADSNLKALESTWKNHQTNRPQQIQNDITMVYGGADVSPRPTESSIMVG